jgi:MtaA/CmuA family methyltransferase
VNGRERVLAVLEGHEPDRLPLMPITMMFAADLAGVRYGDYAANARVLADAQIRTAETFDFDYVSAISDPAREASDLGSAVEWFDDQPPAIIEERALLANKSMLSKLSVPDPAAGRRMSDRVEAVALLKRMAGADRIVEGWVEGPCAMAADLRGLNTLMFDFHDDPEFVRELFDFVVEMELRFARAQIEAGADLIGVGDAAASLIGPKLYRDFVLPYEQRLITGIQRSGGRTRLHICGNTKRILADMGRAGADIVDLDFLAPMKDAREAMGSGQVLLGNLDPVRIVRNGTPEDVTSAIRGCYEAARPRYIAGAGCELPRGTPEANVRALTTFVRTL